jgi:hypothetical protein
MDAVVVDRHPVQQQPHVGLPKIWRPLGQPRSRRLRNPDRLRRRERYHQTPPTKGVNIGRRSGVKVERRLTLLGNARVVRYLAQHHQEILSEFQKIAEMEPTKA